MKRVEISNGEVRIGYELTDLSPEAYETVINDWIDGEIEMIEDEHHPYWDCQVEMEKMQTPWFLGERIWERYKDDIIETIKANEYLFDEDGEILPIVHYTGKHQKTGTYSWGKKEIPCTIQPL